LQKLSWLLLGLKRQGIAGQNGMCTSEKKKKMEKTENHWTTARVKFDKVDVHAMSIMKN